jgi:hypothetical protein
MALGDAWIDVHANTDPFERDLKKNLDKDLKTAGDDASKIMDEIGQDWGDKLGQSTREEFVKHVPRLGEDFSKETEKVHVKVKWVYDYDKNGILKGFKATVSEAEKVISDSVTKVFNEAANSSSGFISKMFSSIGDTISQAAGAIAGVGGGSLQTVMIPLIGSLIQMIGALVVASEAFVAILATVPAIIMTIVQSAGVLFLVFHGMVKDVQAAFAAKNAKELNDAIKNLSPSAQEFVKSLLPLRDLFHQFENLAQEAFFKTFGDSLTRMVNSLTPLLRSDVSGLAHSFGLLFKTFIDFLGSPENKRFMDTVAKGTMEWLNGIGPILTQLLKGFANLGTAATPFLDKLGDLANGALQEFGSWLQKISSDPKTQKWFNDMIGVLQDFGDTIGAATDVVKEFFKDLNTANGKEMLTTLTTSLSTIGDFLKSQAGQESIRALVNVLNSTIEITTVVIIAIGYVAGAIQSFFTWLTATALPWIGKELEKFWNWLDEKTKKFREGIKNTQDALNNSLTAIGNYFSDLGKAASEKLGDIVTVAKGIPKKISDALGNIGEDLYNKGANAIKSFINGISGNIPSIGSVVSKVAKRVADFLGSSPAKEGPLSGDGWTKPRGQRLVRALRDGIDSGAAGIATTMTNATNLMVGGVNLNFYGGQPTQQDATQMGTAAASQLATQFAIRTTRLAIRTA